MSTTVAKDWPNDVELTVPTPRVSPDGPAPAEPTDDEDIPRSLSSVSIDDRASLIGSGVAGVAFTWIVYEHMLGFSGAVGFVAMAYTVFLAFYAGVTLVSNPLPVLWDRLMTAVMAGGAAIIFGLVFCVLGYIYWHGRHAIFHTNFYTQDMDGVRPTAPLTQGGIRHAIIGSGIQIGIAVVISVPLGLGTAVYLSEVGGRGSTVVRTIVEAMTALPDILAGLFVYAFLIIYLHYDRTGLAVAIALSVTMIPIIARSAEVVLRVVPSGLREASLALGASRWKTVTRVVLPTALSGLMTSLILGVARVAGETAPLIIVSYPVIRTRENPLHGYMNSLPYFIYTGVRSGQPTAIDRAYGAAAVLLTLIIVLFATARFIARDKVRSR